MSAKKNRSKGLVGRVMELRTEGATGVLQILLSPESICKVSFVDGQVVHISPDLDAIQVTDGDPDMLESYCEVAQELAQKRLFELLRITGGKFAFQAGVKAPPGSLPISVDVMAPVLRSYDRPATDSKQRAALANRWEDRLKPGKRFAAERAALDIAFPSTVLVGAIQGQQSIAAIMDATGGGVSILRQLYAVLRCGLAELEPTQRPVEAVQQRAEVPPAPAPAPAPAPRSEVAEQREAEAETTPSPAAAADVVAETGEKSWVVLRAQGSSRDASSSGGGRGRVALTPPPAEGGTGDGGQRRVALTPPPAEDGATDAGRRRVALTPPAAEDVPQPSGAATASLTPPPPVGRAPAVGGGESPAPAARPEDGAVEQERVGKLRRWLGRVFPLVEDDDYYKLLELPVTSLPKDIAARHREIVVQFHPDRFARYDIGEDAQRLDRVWKAANKAYSVLSDPDKRKELDIFLDRKAKGLPTDPQVILDAEAKFEEAEKLLAANRYTEAVAGYKEALALNPAEIEFQVAMAWATVQAQTSEGGVAPHAVREAAAKTIEKAIKEMPRLTRAYAYLGQLAKMEKRNSDALRYFGAVVKLDPYNIDAKREIRLIEMRRAKD